MHFAVFEYVVLKLQQATKRSEPVSESEIVHVRPCGLVAVKLQTPVQSGSDTLAA